MNNPNCGACGMLNSRGFCSLTACRFPVVNELGTWQERILANKPKHTNADRIRAMTDEELAEFLLNRDLDDVEKASKAVGFTYKVDRESCLANVLGWLKEEAKE